jgi:RecJ-like exonuclease
MTSAGELLKTLTCPQCAGTGKVSHTYKYKPQHRSDTNVENIERQDVCSLCSGLGQTTQEVVDTWERTQANPVCPLCKGEGGKYFWSWDEGEMGTRKHFTFEPCSLCKGQKHISPEDLTTYDRERRKLRFWGVGCTLLVVVVGLFAVTQVVSILLLHTPWIQCCAPPHVVFVTSMIVISRKIGWI